MNKYKLTLSYDGTNYGGWQVQQNSLSVHTLVQKALSTILREHVGLTGASRTDAGVHALGQTAHFSFAKEMDTPRLLYSLNALLPQDIRVLKIENVPTSFHARYSAKAKRYHYHLHLNSHTDPFTHLYTLHFPYKLDLACIKEASASLVGTHDFTSFANEGSCGAAAQDAVRTLTSLKIVEENGTLRFECEGDGFLYKMVRNIVGTLLDVGCGKILPADILNILHKKDRRFAGRCAPAHALFLVEVLY